MSHPSSSGSQDSQPVDSQAWQAPHALSSGSSALPSSEEVGEVPALSASNGYEASVPPASQAGYGAGYTPGSAPGYASPGYSSDSPQGLTAMGLPYISAPKPGIIPLRPLTIGDLFQASVQAIRANPSVMFGFTLVVMSFAAFVSAFITGALHVTSATPSPDEVDPDLLTLYQFAASISDSLIGGLTTSAILLVVTLILTGVLALTVSDAVLGKKTTVASAWQRLKPRVWALLGYSILNFIVLALIAALPVGLAFATFYTLSDSNAGLVTYLLAGFVFAVFTGVCGLYVTIRFLYGTTVITLENQGVFTAFKRSWVLTRQNFFLTLGRYLLITFAVSVGSNLLSGVVGILSGIAMVFLPEQIVVSVIVFISVWITGLFLPLTSAFITLMYIDRRIRTEGLADVLLQASQQ